MGIEDKDILQVDATIIAGILILLTLSNIAGTVRAQQFAVWVSLAIGLFALSAILILWPHRLNAKPTDEKFHLQWSITLTACGFAYLAFLLIIYFWVAYFLPSTFNIPKFVQGTSIITYL